MIENKDMKPFADMSKEDQEAIKSLPSAQLEWCLHADCPWRKIEACHDYRGPSIYYRQVKI